MSINTTMKKKETYRRMLVVSAKFIKEEIIVRNVIASAGKIMEVNI